MKKKTNFLRIKSSKKAATKEERVRMARVKQMQCAACRHEGRGSETDQCGPTEVHHLVDMGTRELSGGHMATIPLGVWHHRGVPAEGYDVAGSRIWFGPPKEGEGKAFKARYGTDRELLDETNELLANGQG